MTKPDMNCVYIEEQPLGGWRIEAASMGDRRNGIVLPAGARTTLDETLALVKELLEND